LKLTLRELVGLREDDPEGDAVHAEHLDESEVDFLGFEARIDQNEEVVQLFALEDVVGDELREFAHGRLRGAGIAISGQIDQVPFAVDLKMVDQTGLSGCPRHLGQPVAPREHVDQRRLAHVAAADEGNVAQVVLGHLTDLRTAALEFCFYDLHAAKVQKIEQWAMPRSNYFYNEQCAFSIQQ